MNVQQTSKMTKIPEKVLIRMRSRESQSLRSGPPYHKIMSSTGDAIYVYLKKEVQEWMRIRRCLITAGDAAAILGISREEVLEFYGLKGFNVQCEDYRGRLIINNGKNFYIWLPRWAWTSRRYRSYNGMPNYTKRSINNGARFINAGLKRRWAIAPLSRLRNTGFYNQTLQTSADQFFRPDYPQQNLN